MAMSERETDFVFSAKIEACEAVIKSTGNSAGLDVALVDWVVNNYGSYYWCWCADRMLNCENAYTMMMERCGESQCY